MSKEFSAAPDSRAPQVFSRMSDINAAAAARSNYPPRPGEAVDWGTRLWDSDGYEHVLIDLGARQLVTKLYFAYAVWDRASGRCLSMPGGDDLVLRNRPLTEEETAARREQALVALRQMPVSGSVQAGPVERSSGC